MSAEAVQCVSFFSGNRGSGRRTLVQRFLEERNARVVFKFDCSSQDTFKQSCEKNALSQPDEDVNCGGIIKKLREIISQYQQRKFFVFHDIDSKLMHPILSALRMIYGDENALENSQVFLLFTPNLQSQFQPLKPSCVDEIKVENWNCEEIERFLKLNGIEFEDRPEQEIKKLHEKTEGLAHHICEFVTLCINEVSRVVLEIPSTAMTGKCWLEICPSHQTHGCSVFLNLNHHKISKLI